MAPSAQVVSYGRGSVRMDVEESAGQLNTLRGGRRAVGSRSEARRGKPVGIRHGRATVTGERSRETPLGPRSWEGSGERRSGSQETCLEAMEPFLAHRRRASPGKPPVGRGLSRSSLEDGTTGRAFGPRRLPCSEELLPGSELRCPRSRSCSPSSLRPARAVRPIATWDPSATPVLSPPFPSR